MSDTNFQIPFNFPVCLCITCFTLVILINLLLIIPVLKLKKISSTVRMLSLYLLIGVLLSCSNLILDFLLSFDINIINCHVLNMLGAFYLIPSELTVLNLSINSLFLLTNNYFFLSRQKQALIIFSLINWILPLIYFFLYFYIGYSYNFDEYVCYRYTGIVRFTLLIYYLRYSVEVISFIICVIMLIYLCRVNTENNEILRISKRKSMFKKITFMIAIVIFIFYKTIRNIFLLPLTLQLYLYSFFCLCLLSFECIFLWEQRLKESILNTYCSKTSENVNDILNISNTNELMQYEDNN